MAILIDGYNLLHAAGIIPRNVGRGTLERARLALLNWLAGTLDADEVAETTVVFDAANPPPGLPREAEHKGLTVLYSTEHENADALIELLVRKSAVPKRLVVVSSDHRVQRAAKRRRATAVDSDVWYFERRDRQHAIELAPPVEVKPPAPLSAHEVQEWLDEFSELIDDLDSLDEPNVEPHVSQGTRLENRSPTGAQPNATNRPPRRPKKQVPAAELPAPDELADSDKDKIVDEDLSNPFPPGYGEDLLGPDVNLEE